MAGVLEEAKFFGISGILEQLEEMVKVWSYILIIFSFPTWLCLFFSFSDQQDILNSISTYRHLLDQFNTHVQ